MRIVRNAKASNTVCCGQLQALAHIKGDKVHKIIQQENKMWSVVGPSGEVVSSDMTNAQAWRDCDKRNLEPISRAEETSDWSFTKAASGQ